MSQCKNAYEESSSDIFYAYADNNLQKLTIKELREDETFADISEEDALEIIDTLYKLSIITYKIYSENGIGTI